MPDLKIETKPSAGTDVQFRNTEFKLQEINFGNLLMDQKSAGTARAQEWMGNMRRTQVQ